MTDNAVMETGVMRSAVQRVAEVLLADYATEYQADHLTWRDFTKTATEAVEAVVGLLKERAALIPTADRRRAYSLGISAAIDILGDTQ